MENNEIYPNIATEITEILKYVEEPVKEKIPQKLKEELEKISNKEYKFEIDKTKKLNEQNLLSGTKELLSGIFVKYCCDEDEKNEIIVACRQNEIEEEKKKREKYNPDNIFEKKKEVARPDNFKLVVVKKVPWYKKVGKTIASFFQRIIKA